jgi:Uma2 family endonuclease
MSHPKRRATYEELMQVPDHFVAEIIDGELIATPRPATPDARAELAIGRDLAPFDQGGGSPRVPGGWWILPEPELHFGDDVLVPDLAGWRRERMASIPNAGFITLAPDWICEVISPRTGRIDRSRKMGLYAREGVRHLWFVDPLARTLEVYRLEDGRWIVASTHGGDEVVHAEPFDAMAIGIERWWLDDADPQRG